MDKTVGLGEGHNDEVQMQTVVTALFCCCFSKDCRVATKLSSDCKQE